MLNIDRPVQISHETDPRFARLTDYLRANIAGLDGDPRYFQFPGGFSNLTYLIECGKSQFVMKSAPPGKKAKGAHDVRREYQIVSRLIGHYPYLPQPVLYCDDPAIFGENFWVMERLRGVVVRSYPVDGSIGRDIPARQFAQLIDALAELHAIDVTIAGLADFGRPQGYRSRQVAGWSDRLSAARTANMPEFESIKYWLVAYDHRDEERVAVVHNDFKLDNLMWSVEDLARLVGVLDWEMATIGDPLLDLACTLSFWIEAGDSEELRAIRSMPSARPDVMTRRDAIARYAARTGRRIEDLDFYLCFGMFRRAAIEQQKYYRFVQGESGDPRYEGLDRTVAVLLDSCARIIAGTYNV